MSEKIITANQPLVCDLCGHAIAKGCKCRMIRDDYMPFMTYFEHINCPSGAAVVSSCKPKNPIKTNCRRELALA